MIDRHRVKALRLAQGLTLQEAATRAGLNDRQRWFNIEAGKRSRLAAKTLAGVARALGCRPDELVIVEKKIDGARIKKMRIALALTLADAAKESGIGGRQHWWRLESGSVARLAPKTLRAVARTLGCTTKELFS